MLIIEITKDDPAPSPEDDQRPRDGLPAFLAQQGIPPDLITQALDYLSRFERLLLYKPSEDTGWEIREGEARESPDAWQSRGF